MFATLLLGARGSRADSAVPEEKTFQATSACAGACSSPRLVKVDERRVVALFRGDDHILYAQSVDVRTASVLGAAADLGKLMVTGSRDRRALQSLPLPDGDLALFGALRDGRITFARGSEQATRRVPSKVILKGSDLDVVSFAGTATPRGFALLVLRGKPADNAMKPKMKVELHRLGPRGESLGAPIVWTAMRGSTARIGQCGEQLHVAWLGPEGLTSLIVSEDGTRSPESVHAYGKQASYATSQILCRASQAFILATWFKRAIHLGVSSKLSIARLGSTSSSPRWRDLNLPGTPSVLSDSDWLLELSVQDEQLQIAVEGKAGRGLVDVDLTTGKVGKITPLSDRADTCLPLGSAATMLCARPHNDRDASGCWRSKPMSFALRAQTLETVKDRAPCESYWAKAELDNPEAPSASERAKAKERLQCGEREWEPLRKALVTFCEDQARLPEAKQEQFLSAYCGREASSLEAQARTCRLPGATCHGAPKAVPSVERAEYDKGWVGFWQDNCTVWFAREGGTWRVVDGECQGD